MKNQTGQARTDGDKTTQAIVWVILASTGQGSDSDSESDSDQLDANLLVGIQSDNE